MLVVAGWGCHCGVKVEVEVVYPKRDLLATSTAEGQGWEAAL